MKDYYSIQEIRALEDNAFGMGIPVYTLMENAGKAVAEEVQKLVKTSEAEIYFFCGYGNNGGDGLVAARNLVHKGYKCKIILVGNKTNFNSESSQKNHSMLKSILDKSRWIRFEKNDSVQKLDGFIAEEGLAIDCLLGIGIKGEPRSPFSTIIEYINQKFSENIVAVDIPSGYDPNKKNEKFIKNPKKIICLGKNKVREEDFTRSEVIVKDIGIPSDAEEYIGVGDLKWQLSERKQDSHKGQNGIMAIIGGSEDYVGAPALAALGALRTGVDLVYLVVPQDIRAIIASFSPNFISIAGKQKELEGADIQTLLKDERLAGATYVIGPGMKKSEKTRECLDELLKSKRRLNLVIDAGALSCIKERQLGMLKNHNTILTPHMGEFNRIFNLTLSKNIEEQTKFAREVSEKWKITLLLKGNTDIIASKGKVRKNKTGHPGMTVGGTGDVLTGIVGTIFSQLKDPFIASCLAAYISGRAGEIAAETFGVGLLATDIPDNIDKVIKEAKKFVAKEFEKS